MMSTRLATAWILALVFAVSYVNCQRCDTTSEFTCKNGACIPIDRKCDGYPDCRDFSDESVNLCSRPKLSCGEDQWRCNDDKYCIDLDLRCDGVSDCFDDSDELGCGRRKTKETCRADQWKCDDNCIDLDLRCDGVSDCWDDSDESDCDMKPPSVPDMRPPSNNNGGKPSKPRPTSATTRSSTTTTAKTPAAPATNGIKASLTGGVLRHLKEVSNPEEVPLQPPNNAHVEVALGMTLINVPEVDTERNEVEMTAYMSMSWKNRLLRWDRNSEINGASLVTIPIDHVWRPDITAYNFAGQPEDMSPKMAVINADGSVTYVPFMRMRFTCDLSGVDSSSGSNCTLKMGSWVHSTKYISLADPTDIDLTAYFAHSKYEILATSAQKGTKKYPCCPGTYEDVRFSFIIRKKGAGVCGTANGR